MTRLQCDAWEKKDLPYEFRLRGKSSHNVSVRPALFFARSTGGIDITLCLDFHYVISRRLEWART